MKKTIISKLTSIILVILMVLAIIPQVPSLSLATAAATNSKFLVSIDTPDQTAIKIYTAQDLSNIRYNQSGSYILMNDIDLSGFNGGEWVPIEDSNAKISVDFDGQGHIIKNLKITKSNYQHYGLFGEVNGNIKNVGMDNADINVTYTGDTMPNVGGIASGGSSNIDNCYITGVINFTTTSSSLTDSYSYLYVGGLAGSCNNLNNCYSNTNVSVSTTAVSFVGGIVASAGNINNSYNTGSVSSSSNNHESFAGGIAATCKTINNCHNTGAINSYTAAHCSYAGGIAYEATDQSNDVVNCYNTGNVTATTASKSIDDYYDFSSYAGGIFSFGGSKSIKNCYNTGDIKSAHGLKATAGGIVSYCTKLPIESCYNSGNVSATASDNEAYAGGMVGRSNGSDSPENISVCYNAGTITAYSHDAYCGGIIGMQSDQLDLENCFNMGDIDAYDGYGTSAGGIVGSVSNSTSGPITLKNTYSTGNISSSGTAFNQSFSYAGGIVGDALFGNSLNMENCYYLNNIDYALENHSGLSKAVTNNVIALSDNEMKQQIKYLGFDFSMVWGIASSINSGYPYLLELTIPTAATTQKATEAYQQYSYYVDESASFGLYPGGFDLSKKITLKDFYAFIICFLNNKCGFDVDNFLKSKGQSIPSDAMQKAIALQKALGISIDSGIPSDQVLTQQQIVSFYSEYLRIFTAQLSPLIYDAANSDMIRYNFYNQPVVYSTDVISQLMSEIISLSKGQDVDKSNYSPNDNLTGEQLAAMSYMLSTMTLPKDMSGKYIGAITGISDIDAYIAKILDGIITQGMTDEQKIKAVYTYMVKNYTHSDDSIPWLLTDGGINPLSTELDLFMPLYMTNTGTCDAFASGLRLFLLRLGFESNYVSGQYVSKNGSKLGHGWNQVKLNDEWYWLDVDVEGTTYKQSGNKEPSYFLFLKKDDYWLTNHSWNRDEYPACDSTKYPIITAANNTATSTPSSLTAIPTSSTVLVNGKSAAFDAYNINGNNYFKLRDLAYVLSGTGKQFDVGWDAVNNAISLTSGKAYTITGGEMSAKGSGNKSALPTSSTIYLDGKQVSFTAYNIDGNNYFKLRDIGQTFDFGVGWDATTNTITVDTNAHYTS